MSEKDYDEIEKIIQKAHGVVDEITELANLTKQYYEKSDSEFYKTLFKILNLAYCDAGYAMGKAHVQVATLEIGFISNTIKEMT